MIVRASMVELLLERRGLSVELVGDPECEVERIRAWRPRASEAKTLYVGRDDDSPAPALESDACAFLRIRRSPAGPSPSTGSTSRQSEASSARRKTTRATEIARTETAHKPDDSQDLETAYEAYVALEKWDAALKDALLEGVTFDEFIALGTSLIKRPVAYFDRNLITLAASPDYWDREEIADYARMELHLADQMPPDMALDLVEDIDYLHAADEQGGFYYQSAQHRMFYGINTFDGDEYLARLVFSLAEGEQRLHRGEEQLIDVYHAYLDDLHLRYAGNAQVASSQNDSLHALVRAELTGGNASSRDEATAILNAFGWSFDDSFLVAKLVFFEGVHWDTVSLYLCNLLEQTASRSCAFPEEQQIVWAINLSRAARSGENREQLVQRVTTSLVAILRNYACKAGLSNLFTSFADARKHFVEANRALEVGQIRDPHHWYYRFSDYAFDYLLSQCTDELAPEQVCHPALATLIAYDAEHDTEYARTLVCFLRKSQNTTHAAAELYIHRTSFMRRMAHLRELSNVNLENDNDVLHLLLSAKLLGM